MRAFFLACVVSVASTAASAEMQSFSQHRELVTQGTITDPQGSVWNVRFIPGTRKIHKDAKRGWRDAGDSLAELVHTELWSDAADSVGDGLEFSRDVVTDHFAEGIVEDVETAIDRNAELRRGDFGRSFIITWNWVKVATMMTVRTIWLPVGATGGVAYSALAPVARVLWQPTEAVGNATLRGVLAPVVVHLWNGTAWTATLLNAVPERETRWVKRDRSPREYVIDRERLLAIVHRNAEQSLHQMQRRAIEESLAQLQSEVQQLQEKVREQSGQLQELNNNFQRSAPSVNMRRIEQDARHAADTRLADEAEVFLDDEAELDGSISDYLRSRSTEPSSELLGEIRAGIHDDLDQLLK